MVGDHMKEELVELREEGKSNTLFEEAISYVATMCTTLMDNHCFDSKQWELCFTPYIGAFVGQRTKESCLYVACPPFLANFNSYCCDRCMPQHRK